MKTVSMDNTNLAQIISLAAKIINQGGVVIAPFDTVYGIMADPWNEKAIQKIFEIKNRPFSKTIGLAVPGVPELLQYVDIEVSNLDFIKSHIPGPYTFILKGIPSGISPFCVNSQTVAIRIPESELIKGIASESTLLVAQTSANITGEKNLFSYDGLVNQFGEVLEKVDLVIDGGTVNSTGPSIIYNLTGPTPILVERGE